MSQDALTKIFESTELTTAEAIAVLQKELAGVKSILTKFITSEAWVDTINCMEALNFYGETNLIIKKTTAPVPDFIGQIFINTTTLAGYISTGIASVSDWKQIT